MILIKIVNFFLSLVANDNGYFILFQISIYTFIVASFINFNAVVIN